MELNAEESCSTLGGSEHTRRSVSFSLKDNWRTYDGLDVFMLLGFASEAVLLYTFSLLSLNVFQLFFFFFLLDFIYLLILATLSLSCSMRDLCCVMWDLSLWDRDSLVAAHGLCCPMACRILVP